MSNYNESKKQLDVIRNKYNCKGELIFRTAVQLVVEWGQKNFTDKKFIEDNFYEIDERHDKADAEGKYLFMTRDFEKALIECARDIAEATTACNFLMYVQREIWLGIGEYGELSYYKAIKMLKDCINYCTDELEYDDILAVMTAELGFSEEEIEYLGYGYLFESEEEGEE